jgi:uncharacterized protein (TIGR02246 family)
MNRIVVAFLSLLVVMVGVAAFAVDDRETLIALDKKWGEANVKGDAKVLAEIYADDVILLGGQGVATKADAVEGANEAMGRVKNPSYTTSDYKVVFIDENTAIMTHRALSKGVRDGEEFSDDHRSLHVFAKRNGRWQVVANAGVPAQPAS